MLHVLAVADRGLVSHVQAFGTRAAAETGLFEYLKKNEFYDGPDDIESVWQWLEQHDERLSVEITEQTDDDTVGTDASAALKRIHDVLYLDMNKHGEFYNEEKAWDADTLSAIADIVRPLFPEPRGQTAEEDDELTPADRARFVQRIEQVSPYDEGLDADGAMVCPSDFITDLLTDVRHYCDARKVDFAACDRSAYEHYVKEVRVPDRSAQTPEQQERR